MSDHYYYARDGHQRGPVTKQRLKELAKGGNLLPTDMVWTDGMPEWAPAAKFKGLLTAPAARMAEGPPLNAAHPHFAAKVPPPISEAVSSTAKSVEPRTERNANEEREIRTTPTPPAPAIRHRGVRKKPLVIVLFAIVVVVAGGAIVTTVLLSQPPAKPQNPIAGAQAPGGNEQNGGDEARGLLKAALDSWTFRDDIFTFDKNHPNVTFFELDWSASKILQKYEITGSRKSDSAFGGHEISVILTFQSKTGTELKENRVYHVYTGARLGHPDQWHIDPKR